MEDKKIVPYYKKTRLYNPESHLMGGNNKQKEEWDKVFEELKDANMILDVGFHPSAQEGGFCIYYETREAEQKAFVMGFTELGPWIEYHGEIQDRPKEIKVGARVKLLKTFYNVEKDIFDKIFMISKIEKMEGAGDSYDDIYLKDEDGNVPMATFGIYNKDKIELIAHRDEIIPV